MGKGNPVRQADGEVFDVAGQTFTTEFQRIPGITAGAAHAAQDALGKLFIFDGVPERGWIQSGRLFDPDDDNIAIDIIVHNADFGATADDAAYDVSDEDNESIIDIVEFGVFVDLVISRYAFGRARGQLYHAPQGKFYCQAITRGASNIAAGKSPMIELSILREM